MSWESLPSTHVLKPVQRLDMGLSKLLEMETNMQKQAYSNHGMHITVNNNMHDVFLHLQKIN